VTDGHPLNVLVIFLPTHQLPELNPIKMAFHFLARRISSFRCGMAGPCNSAIAHQMTKVFDVPEPTIHQQFTNSSPKIHQQIIKESPTNHQQFTLSYKRILVIMRRTHGGHCSCSPLAIAALVVNKVIALAVAALVVIKVS
jgi:hypothetical protein